jgi:hypothetical protein
VKAGFDFISIPNESNSEQALPTTGTLTKHSFPSAKSGTGTKITVKKSSTTAFNRKKKDKAWQYKQFEKLKLRNRRRFHCQKQSQICDRSDVLNHRPPNVPSLARAPPNAWFGWVLCLVHLVMSVAVYGIILVNAMLAFAQYSHRALAFAFLCL